MDTMDIGENARSNSVKVMERLNHYVALIRYEWMTYLALYEDSTTNGILNRAAPPFFSSLRFQMRSSVVLSLARLFDPITPRQDNLTLYALVESMRDAKAPEFIALIEQRVNEARVEAEPIRQERHKRIAHLDIETILNSGQVWDVSVSQITSLLANVESIVDQIDLELRGATNFRHVYTDMAKAHVAQLVETLQASAV